MKTMVDLCLYIYGRHFLKPLDVDWLFSLIKYLNRVKWIYIGGFHSFFHSVIFSFLDHPFHPQVDSHIMARIVEFLIRHFFLNHLFGFWYRDHFWLVLLYFRFLWMNQTASSGGPFRDRLSRIARLIVPIRAHSFAKTVIFLLMGDSSSSKRFLTNHTPIAERFVCSGC